MNSQITIYPSSIEGQEVMAIMPYLENKISGSAYSDLTPANQAIVNDFVTAFSTASITYMNNVSNPIIIEITANISIDVNTNQTLDYATLSASDKAKYDAFVAMVETL